MQCHKLLLFAHWALHTVVQRLYATNSELPLAACNVPYSEVKTGNAWFSCAKNSSKSTSLAWEAMHKFEINWQS